jgi:hypothetical protein
MFFRRWILGVGFCAAALPGLAHAAVTEDNFQLRTTGDLVSLCGAAPTDAMGTAALNFCQGFGVGVYRVLEEEDKARRPPHLFCMPDPGPTRNEAVASFIAWAKANPDQLAQAPQDGIVAYLIKQYPCKRGR